MEQNQKVKIRPVLVEWLRLKTGSVIGTSSMEDLRNYMLKEHGVLRSIDILSREFRRFRAEKGYLAHKLTVTEIQTDSRENQYLIEGEREKDKDLFGNYIN